MPRWIASISRAWKVGLPADEVELTLALEEQPEVG
jgi:hypothetical protein